MLPERDQLEELAKTYVHFLANNDTSHLKKYLSLDFVTRQKTMEHLKLIGDLPRFVYGFGMEIHLFEEYATQDIDGDLIISPFQFDLMYSQQMNLTELEKATLTIHAVRLKDSQWRIEAIVSNAERDLLVGMINKIKQA